MTCREKLAIEHPRYIDENRFGGCKGCPHTYEYKDQPDYCRRGTEFECTKCWDREILENTKIKKREDEKENTSMSNTKKTKAMLQEEVEQLHQELIEKEKDLAKFDKYKKYEDMGNDLFAAMAAMENAGFTHDEAFILLKTAVGNNAY